MAQKCRFDFQIEILECDETNHTFKASIVPDPRRYEQVSEHGDKYFLDKYLKVLISAAEMASQMEGLPIYHLQPSIDSTSEYANSRRAALEVETQTGEYRPPKELPTRHSDFSSDDNGKDLSFLSIDICGSTAYKLNDSSGFERAYDIFIRELGTIVGQFNGAILKTKGDGFIAYIDHPSFTSQCDATIDLGLSLLYLLKNSVNPALVDAGLGPMEIRIGADYGAATIRQLSIPATGYNGTEVASDALNRSVKIEESCEPGQFRIGRALYELIHVKWLERSKEVAFDGSGVGDDQYKVYLVS